MTKNEAIMSLLQNDQFQEMGENSVVFKADGRYVKLSLQASCTMDSYDVLQLDLYQHFTKLDTERLSLTDPKYRPSETTWRNPKLDQGGYFWGYDKQFYNYKPASSPLVDDVEKILGHWELV